MSGADVEQLPGVPQIAVCIGDAQITAVLQCLNDWNRRSKIKCLCLDIASTNTGHLKGVCPLDEQELDHDMLYMSCRHHVMEIMTEKVVTVLKVSVSSGPDIIIFKRFWDKWSSANQNNFDRITAIAYIFPISDNEHSTASALKQLIVHRPSEGYKELLKLVITVLNAIPSRAIPFSWCPSPCAMDGTRCVLP